MKTQAPATLTTVDQYLKRLEPHERRALEKLRADIHAAAPGVEECISYGMPSFRLGGKVLVWFGATKHHCAFYPGAVVQAFEKELSAFDTSKGTIRFQPEKALSTALVRKLVRARIAQLSL